MITFQQILNGESGLSARAKINSMFLALISGKEGVNAIWVILKLLQDADSKLSEEEKKDYRELLDLIADANNYTDREVAKAMEYAAALDGGIGGLIDSPNYDPSGFPPDKAVTLTAFGPGTYIHFLDVTGTPITVTEDNSITMFYRAANSSYWSYQTKVLDALVDGKEADPHSILDSPYGFYKLVKRNQVFAPITTTGAVVEETGGQTLREMLFYLDNPEYLQAYVDANNVLIEATRFDGAKIIGGDLILRGILNLKGVIYDVVENPEFIKVETDRDGRIINSIGKDGEAVYGGINVSEIKRDLDVAAIRVGYDAETGYLWEIVNNNSSIEIIYDEETGEIYSLMDSKIPVEMVMEPNGDVYLEQEF